MLLQVFQRCQESYFLGQSTFQIVLIQKEGYNLVIFLVASGPTVFSGHVHILQYGIPRTNTDGLHKFQIKGPTTSKGGIVQGGQHITSHKVYKKYNERVGVGVGVRMCERQQWTSMQHPSHSQLNKKMQAYHNLRVSLCSRQEHS